jgi:hypothetical protein
MAKKIGGRAATNSNVSDRRRQFIADWAAFSAAPGEDNIGGATDESVAELQLVVEMLLLGWVDPKTGEHRYFKADSREERAARHSVAYLLRNPKPVGPWLRNRLADLFDPTSINARDLKLGFRSEGRRTERLKHRRIASEMRRIVRASENRRGAVQAAIDSAVEKYGLEVRQARQIWSRYGKPMMS